MGNNYSTLLVKTLGTFATLFKRLVILHLDSDGDGFNLCVMIGS
jgi:hypothetical protein